MDRVVRATVYSAHGLRAAWCNEAAFRQEVVLGAVMIPLAPLVARNWVEAALLVGSVLLVLIVELLNSAVEAVVDRISAQTHELSKLAKDLGSAAVLLSLLLCGAVWIAALVQRLAT